MARIRLLCCICVLGLAACANLDRLQSDQCGNGVIDEREDCDGFPLPGHVEDNPNAELRCGATNETTATKRCRYVCDPMAESSEVCPLGWSCSKDGICLYPVGEYRANPPTENRFDDWAVADVNGDGHPDIVGFTGTSISIKPGTAQGEFQAAQVTSTPPRNSDPSAALMDSDKATDFVLATQDGLLVLKGSGNGALTSIPYATLDPEIQYPESMYPGGVIPIVTHMNSVAAYTPFDHFLTVLDDNSDLQMTFVPATLLDPNPLLALPTYNPLSKLVRPVAVANVDNAPGRMEGELAMAFKDSDKVWIIGQNPATLPVPTLEVRSEVTLTAMTVDAGALFADVNGDGSVDLLVGVDGDRVAVATGLGNGSFNPPAIDSTFDALLTMNDPFDQLDDIDTVFTRWPLVAADFDGDGQADYVSPQGVYVTGRGAGLTQSAWRISEDPWTKAVAGDFNGDGNLDLVAAVDPDEGSAKLDLLFGDGNGDFTAHVIDATGVAIFLAPGDFDGDLVTDLAIAIQDTRDQDEDQVVVLFGARDGVPANPINMGKFSFIEEMQPGAFWSPLQAIPDRNDDLLVFTNKESDFSGARRVALLNGSKSRRLAAPFTLISAELGGAFSPEMAIAGRFSGQSNAGDVLVLASDDEATDTLWFVQGSDNANLADPVKLPLGTTFGDEECSAEDALWVKGDIDGDGATDLIGLSNSSECDTSGFGVSQQPSLIQISMGAGPTLTSTGPDAIPGGFLVPYHAVIRDVDDDGNADLVVTYSGEYITDFGQLATGAGVVVYWNDNGSISLTNPSAIPIPSGVEHVIAAGPLQADDDGALEVAVFTNQGVQVCHLEGRTFADSCDQHSVGEGFFRSELGGERLYIADVNGDGLDDVIIGDGTQIFIATAQSQLDASGQGGTP